MSFINTTQRPFILWIYWVLTHNFLTSFDCHSLGLELVTFERRRLQIVQSIIIFQKKNLKLSKEKRTDSRKKFTTQLKDE